MSWNTATAEFAKALDNYESRPEQDRLATAIEDAIADQGHFLGEAGCGTGKSFAYLIPAAFTARSTRKPSVVATATKALQAQLAGKDLPFLQQVFPWLSFAVVKGRSNYACMAKLNSDEAPAVAADVLHELASNDEHSGDLDDLATEVRPGDRSKIAIVGDECPGKSECPFGEVCFAERAKARAADAHVVVANHSVLLRDTEIKNLTNGKAGMLPHYGVLVVDEAHELEEYATGALGVEFGQAALERLADDAATFLRESGYAFAIKQAAKKIFSRLDRIIGERGGRNATTLRLDDNLLGDIFEDLHALLIEVDRLHKTVKEHRASGDEDRELAQKRMIRRIAGMHSRLTAVLMADGDEIVRWIERKTRTFRGQESVVTMLAFAPLHVGPYLSKNLWDLTPAILVSATLSAGDRGFDYVAERLGLIGQERDNYRGYTGFNAGSPFDFTKQSALYIPQPKVLGGTFPNEPKDNDWSGRTIAEMGELIRTAGGRTLALFTSRREMDAAYATLLPQLRALGVQVLKQGDAPNGQLSQTFKNDETSVLFALKSFMTGADFQGATCSLVIINKLPFPVPTDVIHQARAEAIDMKATTWNQKSFMQLSVPIMVLTLQQAFGRAVRTKSDKAMVAIFDPRLVSKGYGQGIVRALPDAQRVNDLAAARGYLAEILG